MRPTQPRLRQSLFPKIAYGALALAILGSGVFEYANRHGQVHSSASSAPQRDTNADTKHRLLSEYGKLPLAFEPNQGQSDPEVKYTARGNGYTLFLTSKAAVLSLIKPAPRGKSASSTVVRM